VESVLLQPLRHSGVGGRVFYQADGDGTKVWTRIRGVRIVFHAGTCARHGASFAALSRGELRFHGQQVDVGTVADGKHVFVAVANGRELACARIPGIS
jgi:hypothetical protein